MPDSWIKLVPVDHLGQPSRERAEAARHLFEAFAAPASEVTAAFFEEAIFVDPGENWSGVRCPVCRQDAGPWWAAAMDKAYEGRFRDLSAVAPCCSEIISLNALDYVWPAGFARFVLAARNAAVGEVSAEQKGQLEDCLGMALRQIFVRV